MSQIFGKVHFKVWFLICACVVLLWQWKGLSDDNAEKLEVVKALFETREAFVQVRSLLRHVGEAARVPVSSGS